MNKKYSIRKAHKIMNSGYDAYRKETNLTEEQRALFQSHLRNLDAALLKKDRENINLYANKVEEFYKAHITKSLFTHTRELVLALVFALIVAVIVRQMWFELYEIPTGSMRPTYQEKDHLTVSKTQFGLNKIMMPGHFYFDPELVKRSGVIIFLGDNLPIDDGTSYYFDLIPYSKRFIKRLIAKPGDTVYFYGGKIYALDEEGVLQQELLDAPWMLPLEHIPFLSFTGRTSVQGNQMTLKQMNLPVGKVTATPFGTTGEVYTGGKWIADKPNPKPHDHVESYSDLWGIGNYAMARLLTKDQLQLYPELDTAGLEAGKLYLELAHHPTLASNQTVLHTHKTLLPLDEAHLKTLMEHMNTTRFVVEQGHARNYNSHRSQHDADFSGVPDGTYQITNGNAQQVGLGAILYDLPKDHPLYSLKNIQKLYNLGVEFNNAFKPLPNHPFPNRYAYFRDGDLYLLGNPIFKKDDPILAAFNARELAREEKGNYIAFKDLASPVDAARINAFGLKIPQGQYLVLGDNHAISADSRVMGFIPEDNLQGVPDVLLWPPGSRWPIPEQTPYPLFTAPRILVWIIVGIITAIALMVRNRSRKKRTAELSASLKGK